MAPWTPAFKCFLGGSTGLGGQADRATIRSLFLGAARAGRMIVAHCEDEARLAEDRARYPQATAAEHHLVRSSAAEIDSIELAIELALETGASLHVFHVSTAEGAKAVARARARTKERFFASTAPHYLLLSCEDAGRLENRIKVNPSVKTPSDRKALIEAVARGSIDAIGTDHAPHPREKKQLPYAQAPSGMPSVDLLWPLTYELVRTGQLGAERALASVTSSAAQSLRLPRKGRLASGYDGDVVLFAPEEERAVEGAGLPSRSKWSAYEGMRLAGFPQFVVRRGTVCLREGEISVDAGGAPLELEPPGSPPAPS
jgi:dihydroorotase